MRVDKLGTPDTGLHDCVVEHVAVDWQREVGHPRSDLMVLAGELRIAEQ